MMRYSSELKSHGLKSFPLENKKIYIFSIINTRATDALVTPGTRAVAATAWTIFSQLVLSKLPGVPWFSCGVRYCKYNVVSGNDLINAASSTNIDQWNKHQG